jgi:hypothetical protein
MDTFEGTCSDLNNQLEAPEGSIMQEGSSIGDIILRNLDNDLPRLTTPSPGRIANLGGTPTTQPMKAVDAATNLCPLPQKSDGHLFVTLPDTFDGKKENY